MSFILRLSSLGISVRLLLPCDLLHRLAAADKLSSSDFDHSYFISAHITAAFFSDCFNLKIILSCRKDSAPTPSQKLRLRAATRPLTASLRLTDFSSHKVGEGSLRVLPNGRNKIKTPTKIVRGLLFWLPEQDSKRTNSKVITEEIPYYYKWHNKTKTLFRGPKPDFIQIGKIITQREQEHHDFVKSYENPIEKALDYARMMQKEKLSQQPCPKIGYSQSTGNTNTKPSEAPSGTAGLYLGKWERKMITERSLRDTNFIKSSLFPDSVL